MQTVESPGCGCTQKCGLTGHTIAYLAWHYEAESRHRAGQRQRYCTVCGKWRWPDEVGPWAKTLTQKQFDAVMKRAGEDVELARRLLAGEEN